MTGQVATTRIVAQIEVGGKGAGTGPLPSGPPASRYAIAQRICETAAHLLGIERIRLWHDQALYKEAGGCETDAHRDQPYWPIAEADTVTAWIPLADVDEVLGCMGLGPPPDGRQRNHRPLRRRPRGQSWREEMAAQAKAALRYFEEVIGGDTPLRAVGKDEVRRFREETSWTRRPTA